MKATDQVLAVGLLLSKGLTWKGAIGGKNALLNGWMRET